MEGYRIFYHEAAVLASASDSNDSNGGAESMLLNATMMSGNNSTSTEIRRLDVKDTSVSIDGLKKDILYELVIKAGNVHGKHQEGGAVCVYGSFERH